MPVELSSGPCGPWCTTDDLRCGAQTGTPQWSDSEYIAMASDILFELSGRRFPGECEKTEWPTRTEPGRSTVVRLDTPFRVIAIDSVTQDGSLVSALEYEVHDWRYLVRIPAASGRNDGWNAGQASDLGGGIGSLKVVYTHGEPVPPLGVLAAATLTCSIRQMWCNQPSVSPVQLKEQARRAALDVDIVQTFLKTYPTVAPVMVWSPELDSAFVKTWP